MDTKALRQKILDLAIRGKLVPQDPNDEPASVLLERIRAEKQQMVKDGKLKAKDIKNDSIIYIGEDNYAYEKFPDGTVKCIQDEIPFELPEGWEWTRLGYVFSHNTGKALNKTNTKGTLLTYITTSNLYWNKFELGKLKSMYFNDIEIEKCTVKKGDLLVCEGGDIGRAAIWNYNDEIRIQNHIHRLRPFIEINIEFYYHILYYYKLIDLISGKGIGIQGLSSNQLHSILIPIPPLSEQQRIVTKLNELLSFVDVIESDKTDLQDTIQLTKSKILDLAIRGKLVPQNPNDEPANVLLDRIRAEKQELIKQGKIKPDKRDSVIFKGDDNSYYLKTGNKIEAMEQWNFDCIPNNWELCLLGEICDYGNCSNVDTKDIDDSAWILDLEDIEKDTGKVLQKIKKSERNSASTKHLFHKGQVLYSKLRPYLNKVILADDDGYCTSEILPLDFPLSIIPEYARYYFMSPTFLRYANHCSYGVKMPRLGTTDGKKAVFPFPPLNEQKRIADKVSQLFSLLDYIADSI